MKGYIHSKETFGTVDGPGIRYVLFMQGCPLRCMYCHNPDTWEFGAGEEVSPEEIIGEYLANKQFYTKGGITVTGGEPLMQTEFVTELFKEAKKYDIHTCIDTSGVTYNPANTLYMEKLDNLLEYTDLVMLDIKHIDSAKHEKLTGKPNHNILEFAKYLSSKDIPLWIRHIIIEGITDDARDLINLGEFIGKLKSLKALDVLPYHTMGVHKYKELGIPYPLEGVEPLPVQKAAEAKKSILEGIKHTRR